MRSLRDDLLEASAYRDIADSLGAEVQAVECIETHVSRVFLAGEHVFKTKKPVALGFLDFTTLEQRKRACEAEVALNRRLAPDVYEAVVPVLRGADGRHRIGRTLGRAGDGAERDAAIRVDESDGTVVDFAVRMRRLPDDERADVRLVRGQLGKADIARLAARLVDFHDEASSFGAGSRFGTVLGIAAAVEQNFEQTRESVREFLSDDEARSIERWQLSFLEQNRSIFEKRREADRIRDGHGDLRLEHVYFRKDGSIVVLDGIEFNDDFRCEDVCADIAFLAMDLAWHGRVDLAERFVAEYAMHGNDFDLYAVADFYESYRAYVRAKVSTMLAGDATAPDAARARARAEARRYFVLALAASRKSLLGPTVVAVGGIIASGKSTLAAAIADELGAPVIEADRTRKHMLGVSSTARVHEPPFKGAYDPRFTARVYDETMRRAGVVLASGRPVVLDASFRTPLLRERARKLSQDHGVPFRFVECRVDLETCRARLVERETRERVSDGRLAILDDFCASYEPPTELLPDEHVVVDTGRPLEESLESVREAVATWPRGLVG
jgi:aminoglycoside phosphotransferase family enzyme/predicted kinase